MFFVPQLIYTAFWVLTFCLSGLFLGGCSSSSSKEMPKSKTKQQSLVVNKPNPTPLDTAWKSAHDSTLVEVLKVDKSFILDIRYATTNNFMKIKVYPCDKCLLRKCAAEALKKANDLFKKDGFMVKIYDGYRPLSVQWELWNRTSNKNYVANPRKGSNHNRGCAVDMTLTDLNGKELDMGTPYDFFGPEAHHTYTNLPAKVLKNRQKLKSVMESVGFKHISNEWWHYDYKIKYSVLDQPLPCDKAP